MQCRLGLHRLALDVLAVVALTSLAAVLAPTPAAAQRRAAGAVSVLALISDAPSDGSRIDYGAGAIADLYVGAGLLRLGGALGLAAVSSADGVRSRVYMPLAASLSAHLPIDRARGLDLRARAGLWAGATDTGLDADFFGSFGGWLTFAIGAGASVAFGLDVLVQRAAVQDEARSLELYFAPGIGLVWGDPPQPLSEGRGPRATPE